MNHPNWRNDSGSLQDAGSVQGGKVGAAMVRGQKRNLIGIVNGMNSLAGADLFFKLGRSALDGGVGGRVNTIVEQQSFQEKLEEREAVDRISSFKLHLFAMMRNLAQRHASCVLFNSFTGHTFLEELRLSLEIPVISMMEGLRHCVETDWAGTHKIGVLTSAYVREQQLFERIFSKDSYELIYPSPDVQRDCLEEAVCGPEGIQGGRFTEEVVTLLQRSCRHLHEKGAELIIPGLSDILAVFNGLSQDHCPILDINQAYVDWALQVCNSATVKRHPKIGIIGGLGPSATLDLMAKIVKGTKASCDQEHYKMVVEYNPQIPDRTACLLEGKEDPTIPLYKCAKQLEERDADFISVPCNTAHAFIDRIQKYVSIPFINMIDEVVIHIRKHFPLTERVGLLATSGTVATGIYARAFGDTAMELLVPDSKHQAFVMEAIYGERGVKAGHTEGEALENLLKAAECLCCQGAEVLILGCTELPLILAEDDNYTLGGRRVAIVDPTNILAGKCIRLIENFR